MNYQYQKVYREVYPYVEAYIKDENKYSRRLHHIKKKLERQVILEILLTYSKDNHISIVDKFEELGYIDELIHNAQKSLNLELIKTLGLIKSKKSFEVLKNALNTDDYEVQYHSYYAISLLALDKEQVKTYISSLLSSGMIRDRVIEMIINLTLSTEAYFDLLKEEQTEQGKVIFLRVLENKLDLYDEEISDQLVKFLSGAKEVKIAAVVTLASTSNNKYFNLLRALYDQEEAWEVRAAIAKSIDKLSHPEDIVLLKKMIYDPNWWVRFNTAQVLAKKGVEGIDALIDISLTGKEDAISDLAYYILNSNQSVNKTIIELKEEHDG